MLRRLTSAHAIALVALFISLGGAGYSATGGYFILGRTNAATTTSALTANINGRTLQLQNSSTGVNATPLALLTLPTHPPMIVNSGLKVVNLNVDKLDGLDSTQFVRPIVVAPFNLAAGATSAPIVLPYRRPVILFGAVTTQGRESLGQAHIIRTYDGTSEFLAWTGRDGPSLNAGPGSDTVGRSNTSGAHIVFIDVNELVEIEINNGNSIRVHNASTGARAGTVTLMW